MSKMHIFYYIGTWITPHINHERLKLYLRRAGVEDVPYARYGFLFFVSLIMTFALFSVLIYPNLDPSPVRFILYTLGAIASIQLLLYLMIFAFFKIFYDVKIFKRKHEIEKAWPEYIDELKTNLEAGLTFHHSLIESVSERFMILEKEIETVAKKSITGEDTVQALNEFASKYHSDMINESVDIMSIGMTQGGSLKRILEKICESIKLSNQLRREAISSVMGYIFFITIITCVIAPILFATSFNLLLLFQNMTENLNSNTFGGGEVISTDTFVNFSRFCIVIISVFAGAIISNLRTGSVKGGIMYIPTFLGISIIIYEIARIFFTLLFGVMIG